MSTFISRLDELDAARTQGLWGISRYTNYAGWSISAPNHGCLAERWYPMDTDEAQNAQMQANADFICFVANSTSKLRALVKASEALVESTHWREATAETIELAACVRALEAT